MFKRAVEHDRVVYRAPRLGHTLQSNAMHRGSEIGQARGQCQPYLLGLLAMIKCSICSYQCDN